jgi:hypothetical protein
MKRKEGKLAAFIISPRYFQANIGNNGVKEFGMKQAPMEVKSSCMQTLQLIYGARKHFHGVDTVGRR